MKVSESWLREWVNPSLTTQKLSALLTQAGLEVDSTSPVAGEFNEVIVARVVETKRHPQADKLTLCEVDTGQNTRLKIVCGASNVRSGLVVALALPGAHLPGNIHIKESTLRGELSQGMLCSSTELGLDDESEGIIELPEDAPIGQSIREYLSLDDHVIDIDLTPNRGDCFSIRGIAREVAALSRMPFNDYQATPISINHSVARAIHLNAPNACTYFATREIHAINPHAQTPLWLKERLRRAGVKVRHPVVDVINYVMLELGVPMHAYDASGVKGDLHVRMGQTAEQLTLLNEQDILLTEKVLVIADDNGPLAMAGIMGGLHSSVHADTTDIILESAFFNPLTLAGVARSYGLSTDAAMRFERGVDPTFQVAALERATALLISIVGGSVGPVTIAQSEVYSINQQTIDFDPSRVEALTGVSIPHHQMILMLESLGLVVEHASIPWRVKTPSYRFDLTLAVDLVEEVMRLYGYDQLHSAPIFAPFRAGHVSLNFKRTQHIMKHLIARGYHETISYSFVDPELHAVLYPEVEKIALVNPISSELSEMRVSIWPGLLATMMHNVHRQQTTVQCFEAGVVFQVTQGVVKEKQVVAGLLAGETGGLNWSEATRTYDFYDVKGDLESVFHSMGWASLLSFKAELNEVLHPGKSARIYLGETPVGWLGVLHPRLADAFDVAFDVMLFELSLDELPSAVSSRYQPISKYPSIRRDLSLLVDEQIPAGDIEHLVRQVVSEHQLKAFNVFDHYAGEGIPQGKKSIAIAMTLQNEGCTLTDGEINTIIDAILEALRDKLAIILRD